MVNDKHLFAEVHFVYFLIVNKTVSESTFKYLFSANINQLLFIYLLLLIHALVILFMLCCSQPEIQICSPYIVFTFIEHPTRQNHLDRYPA
jgi:hypothetical protein